MSINSKEYNKAVARFDEALRGDPELTDADCNLRAKPFLMQDGSDVVVVDRNEANRRSAKSDRSRTISGNSSDQGASVGKAPAASGELRRLEPELVVPVRPGIPSTDRHDLEKLREAVRLKSDDSVTRCKLGAALIDAGKPDEAITELREAIRIQPADRETHKRLGDALAIQGKLDEATAEYTESKRLELRPASVPKAARLVETA